MDRRAFVLAALAGVASPRAALAQGAKKVWRVGYLSMASPEADRQWVAALREGLRELGYVEGQNTVLELRHASSQAAKMPGLAADLVRRDVAVIVAYGSAAIDATKKAAATMPIVMTVHADPVGTGTVASMARPGGTITGLTDGHADLAPKRLELIKEVVPSASRVAALLNPATPHAVRQLEHLQSAGPRMGVTILPIEINGANDIERAFAVMAKQRSDALVLIPDPTWWVGQQRRVANLALKYRLPAIGTVREFADQGILLAYGTNFAELWHRSATYVDKILKGANPGDLPIEHPTRFHLVINLKTAKTLGITVPRSVLLRADQVLE